MYADEGKPDGLGGVLSMFNMKSYWEALKNKIGELKQLGYSISLYQQRLGIAYTNLMRMGKTKEAELLKKENDKVKDDLDKWWKVKGYIDTYLPQWVTIDQGAKAPTSGVGAVPIMLGVAAISALAYTVNVGMALLQDYSFKKHLTEHIITQKMSSGQAAEILSVSSKPGAVEQVVGKFATGLGFGLPTMLLVGGGIYLMVSSGVLGKMLKR